MEKKKLLFLGADTSTMDAVQYAKKIGIYTIVTDYRPIEKVPAKMIADEAWMIDVADTDTLECRCREETVNAVYAGNHEFCLDQCKKLCKRIGLPFYANNDGWRATRDKEFYKKICMECGLDTPKWIRLRENMDPDEIAGLSFPVVVKPTDSCAQQGLSIIYDPADLPNAYKEALVFSFAKEVIAEEYIDGDEIVIFSYIHEGKPICLSVGEHLWSKGINKRNNFGYLTHNGLYNRYIREDALPKLEKVVLRLGCREGECLFQCIYKNGTLYHFELGYRLDGMRTWRHHRRIYGISELELMVDLSLGIIDEKKILAFSAPLEDYHESAAYALWAKPGIVRKITGLQELLERPDILVQVANFKEGDRVLPLDNMRSIGFGIFVYAETQKGLGQKIHEINETLHMYDEQGNDMLVYRDDYYESWCTRVKKGL